MADVGAAFRRPWIARHSFLGLAVTFVVCAVAVAAGGRPAALTGDGRVVAIGDIHGDYEAFAAILQRAGLVDERLRWSGGRATLVQTGDFLDRGARVRDVMDLLRALEAQAPRAGGRVMTLLGNHEAMNLIGDVRDVSDEAYAAFADGRSERRREEGYRLYAAAAAARGVPGDDVLSLEAWRAQHPAGFIEYRAAFSADGAYGRWLRRLPVVAHVGDTIFLHGGLHPDSTDSVDEINRRMRQEIEVFDGYQRHMIERGLVPPFFAFPDLVAAVNAEVEAYAAADGAPGGWTIAAARRFDDAHVRTLRGLLGAGDWMATHGDSPLWYRGFATWTDEEGPALLEPLLERYEASRFVVGHTIPATFRITPRFDGRIVLIDTGMLSSVYRGGRASALELVDGRMTPIYLDERVVLDVQR